MHESDLTPGLANKLSLPFVSTFFTTFPETQNCVKQKQKVNCVGPVMSDRLFNGDRKRAGEFTKLSTDKKTIMFIGGSLGAHSLNNAVEQNFKSLLKEYQIIHISGKNGFNPNLKAEGYIQYEYVDNELKDLMALADVVISRAGSNSIFELASLNKPMVLVPLPNTSSRGEQTLNAKNFVKKGFASLIKDEDIANPEILLNTLKYMFDNKEKYIKAMQDNPVTTTTIQDICSEIAK